MLCEVSLLAGLIRPLSVLQERYLPIEDPRFDYLIIDADHGSHEHEPQNS